MKFMQIDGWKYYSHAAIPTTPPHEPVNLEPINNGNIWKCGGGTTLIARWHTEWDCGYETNWWYCIKDTPFHIDELKSKRRYEINKGRKNFIVTIINPNDYLEEIFIVATQAFSVYPEKYRPNLNKSQFFDEIRTKWKGYTVFGAFNSEAVLSGYACCLDHETYSDFTILKANPKEEKLAINAALVYSICEYYREKLETGNFYICDGARSIRHQTHFQDYLEKYFGFRKSYCHLHIKYRMPVLVAIRILRPICRLLALVNNSRIYDIVSLIEMDKLRSEG